MKSEVRVALGTLETAEVEVGEAEKQLSGLLAAIQIAPRAEKTSVSRIVETSLQRLRSALVSVEAAKKVLAASVPDETDETDEPDDETEEITKS